MTDISTYEAKQSRETRENRKFVEDTNGDVAVRTLTEVIGAIEGSFAPSGLKNAGRVTVVQVNSSTWTALPLVPLTDRNAMSVQNESDIKVKINYSDSVSGFEGMTIYGSGERYYDVKDTITLYGKCETGTVDLNVEELS